ncbi:MAG: HEAT repeat domain-containing protein [Candidatus Omnitrophica bacterium]|nr:HEAT repeat domain-containing protein [Candidatus Omnitrophota bacterium]
MSVTQLKSNLIAAAESESDLLAVLKSDAGLYEKTEACRKLAVVGGKSAVEPLIALLGDEKLSHMARYGLETNPDSSVDKSLVEALGALKGKQLMGVIASLGVRRDANAVEALAGFLKDADSEIVQTAARSLGRIGGLAAIEALKGALEGSTGASRIAICEGLLRCAETAGAKGDNRTAKGVYDSLREVEAPHQVRAGALLGAIHSRKKNGMKVLLEALHGDDFAMAAAAARAAQELQGEDVSKALAEELPKLSADKQVLVAQTLGDRGDKAGLGGLLALARSGDRSARLAAIRAIPQLGDPAAVDALKELTKDSDGVISRSAQRSINALTGVADEDSSDTGSEG